MAGPFGGPLTLQCGCCTCPQLLCVRVRCRAAPVAGAAVTISLDGVEVDSGTTDSLGNVCFTVEDEGTYTVEATWFTGTACECSDSTEVEVTCARGATVGLENDCGHTCCFQCKPLLSWLLTDAALGSEASVLGPQLFNALSGGCCCAGVQVGTGPYGNPIYYHYMVGICTDDCSSITVFKRGPSPLEPLPGCINLCHDERFIFSEEACEGDLPHAPAATASQLTIVSCVPFVATDGNLTLEWPAP